MERLPMRWAKVKDGVVVGELKVVEFAECDQNGVVDVVGSLTPRTIKTGCQQRRTREFLLTTSTNIKRQHDEQKRIQTTITYSDTHVATSTHGKLRLRSNKGLDALS